MTLLPLNSPEWARLEQAYGGAEDVPRLIEHLDACRGRDLDELWFGLWSTLWRDGRVYSASYAALPHLVAYATRQSATERARALHLVVSIELARLADSGPALPNESAATYHLAIAAVPDAIAECVNEPWSADTAQILCAALALAKGNAAFAAAALQSSEASG